MGRRARNARNRPNGHISDKFVKEMIGPPLRMKAVKTCATPHAEKMTFATYSEANTAVNNLTNYDAYKETTVKHCTDCNQYVMQLAA